MSARQICAEVHPDDCQIVCTLYEHERDHHRGWLDTDDGPKPIHWGSQSGRLARSPARLGDDRRTR